jgi:hypothetical protein
MVPNQGWESGRGQTRSSAPTPDPLLLTPYSLEWVEGLVGALPPALAALDLPDEFVLPRYHHCIGNLPATLAMMLGANLGPALPPLADRLWRDLTDGLQRVVWVIVDALGWVHFQQLTADLPALFGRLTTTGRLVPITSVFPSTTTAALTTLWSGYAPGQHALVGHELYLREFGLVVDTLGFSPSGEPRRGQMIDRGLVPEQFVPVPGLAEVLSGQGIATQAMIAYNLISSGLSRLCFRGVAQVEGLVGPADMWVWLRQMLADRRDERLLLVAYWGDIDQVGHRRSPSSASWVAEVRNLFALMDQEFLQRLSPAARKGTLLVITADHGQAAGNPDHTLMVPQHAGLYDRLLLPPTGSPRSAYLFARQGMVAALDAYFREHLADRFHVVGAQAALRAGLLGPQPLAAETVYRLGDLVVLGRGDWVLHRRTPKYPVLGLHGGLSPWEMLVPLLLTRLD